MIYLLRHGEVEGASTRRFIGHLDVPLSAEGERQCAAQAARLRTTGLTAVFSSDLGRSRRSAEIIGAPHGLIADDRARRCARWTWGAGTG